MSNSALRRMARLELARRDFWEFCKLLTPRFYLETRPYLRSLCEQLQAFFASNQRVVVVNLPPRHGKSRTAIHLAQWLLGRDPTQKIMTGSYNEILSTTFSRAVRDGIMEQPFDLSHITFSDVFPGVRIKRGESSARKWALEGQFASYLATSPSGTATGFGATILIIDDLIKKSSEAFHETTLDKHWSWFTDTMLSRMETGYKIMIIMTRWASGDLAGRALRHWKDALHISMQALQPDGSMLCDDILSRQDFEDKRRTMSEEIASANYQQKPIDLKGKLYNQFRTYETIPQDQTGKPLFSRICNYTDTADTGKDFLCSITYGEYQQEAYILDVYFTKESMEITEPETARRLLENNCNIAWIESNNGGRGFARNVERIMREQGSNRCRVEWFHQTENKTARILTNATWVQHHILFPVNWRDRWSEYYSAMAQYQKSGGNAHDDAPDATTGVAELLCNTRRPIIPQTTENNFYQSYWRR